MNKPLPAIRTTALILSLYSLASALAFAARSDAGEPRYVIADQDAAGPGGSDMTSLARVSPIAARDTSGNYRGHRRCLARRRSRAYTPFAGTRGKNGRQGLPGSGIPAAAYPETSLLEQLHGSAKWKGAWRAGNTPAEVIPPLPEGTPTTRPADEDAAHFMLRMVHQYPHRVTIYGAGPMTNIALAIRLDRHFAELAKELVIMGGSLNAKTDDPEFVNNPRHEFNFWFDPEAASITLRAPWAKITDTTVDASIESRPTEAMLAAYSRLHTSAARYLTKYTERPLGSYLWDELAAAAWLDPSIITRERLVYMDVNTTLGPGYGDTLIWNDLDRPGVALQSVHAQLDIDADKLQSVLYDLFSKPAPGPNAIRIR